LRTLALPFAVFAAFAACNGPAEGPAGTTPAPADPYVRLSPPDRLIRASIALRGVRPSALELQTVNEDPSALAGLVHDYTLTPEFGLTIKDMWAEILQLRNDSYLQLPARNPPANPLNPEGIGLDGYDLQDIYTGTTEEPLRLVEHIVTNDLPFTDLVTAQYVLVDDVTARMYGVPYDFTPGAEKWQMTEWSDERPKAGILSSAQVFRRWESNGSNFHRGRANMVARELLCEDFDHRDILVEGGINIADEAAVATAVQSVTACIGCHQALDPLAGYFWGYKQLIHRNFVGQSMDMGCEFDWSNGAVPEFGPSYLYEYYCYPIQQYNPADEYLWEQWGLPEPSYYGTPARDLKEVGELIADDPRFSECQARQFYGYYAQLDPTLVGLDTALQLQASFESTGFDARQLAIDSVLRDEFSILRSNDPVGHPVPPGGGLLTVRPEQYDRIIADLTGYRWMAVGDKPNCDDPVTNNTVDVYGNQCWGEVDLGDSDLYGFRAMSGGIDGVTVSRPTHTATPTKLLAMDALAANAAGFVVNNDFLLPATSRRLLWGVEPTTVDEPTIRAQLVGLHLRILGEFVAADSPQVDLTLGLWNAGYAAAGSATDAWKLTLTGMLQDPRMMYF
jgi:hypothetical protein